MGRKLRHLLLTTTEDSFDIKAWSGIPYSLRSALERRVERLSVFHPPRPARSPLGVLKRVLHGQTSHPLWISKAALRRNARTVTAAIQRIQPDAVLTISSQALVATKKLAVPAFLFVDAPYMTFAETYARWETYPARLPEFAAEEAALGRRLDGLCFGSQWACVEAARQYALPPQDEKKLHVTPLGANFVPTGGADEVAREIAQRRFDRLQLLFVGRDWERKGGPLTIEVVRLLRQAGIAVTLHIVGCNPTLLDMDGAVEIHGLLSRGNDAERRKLEELYLRSHFLITPTLAECFGIVFAEAHAFGLPAISRAVDAVPSIVLDGETGLLFDPAADAPAYVERILQLFQNPQRYRAMAIAARARSERALSWDSCASGIADAIDEVLDLRVVERRA